MWWYDDLTRPGKDRAILVLDVALLASIALVSALGGAFAGARVIQRDLALLEPVLKRLEIIEGWRSAIRADWAATQEGIDATLGAVETRRRRAAASESRMQQKEAAEQIAEPMDRTQELEAARARRYGRR